ncbi:MAG: nitronate monooxygenase, partial [Pseudomonadota bacterium]|nr:nitronate monooxygenase [Pseudomonadota bacterium]
MESEEVIAFLNTLLKAERAGAKVIAQFMLAYPEQSNTWNKLREMQRDEARNCSILIALLHHAGGVPSHETGDFLGKALAIQNAQERLQFLNRGQSWVARKIPEWIPKI